MQAFIVEATNRPGELAKQTEAIASRGINILCCSLGIGDRGGSAILASDEASVRSALTGGQMAFREIPVLTLRLADRPGEIARVSRKLADAKVNIELLFPVESRDGTYTIVVGVDKLADAQKVLAENLEPYAIGAGKGTPAAQPSQAAEARAVSRRYIDEVINKGNVNVIDELAASDFVEHNPPQGVSPDREGLKKATALFHTAFPDGKVTVEEDAFYGDRLWNRYSFTGTHDGELFGMPPTHRPVKTTAIDVTRFSGGKIVEHWSQWDLLTVMQQIGAVPEPSAAPTTR